MLIDMKRSSALTNVLAPNVTNLLKTARRELAFLSHHLRAEQAAHILDIFEQELRYLANDIEYPIRLFESIDGALIIEWATPGCRAVVNLEEDNEESGWHIVTRSNDSGCQTIGALADLDIKRIINCIATNLDKQ